jgi:hypothetical protein
VFQIDQDIPRRSAPVDRKRIRRSPIKEIEAPVVPKRVARSLRLGELSQLLGYEGHRPVDKSFVIEFVRRGGQKAATPPGDFRR